MSLPIEQEKEVMTQLLALRNDPLGCATYSFPWGQKGSLFENFKGPRPHQAETMKRIGDHIIENEFRRDNGMEMKVYKGAKSSGRGPGKTAEFAMLAHWFMSTRIGAPVIATANTEGQLRNKVFAEMSVWFGAAINAHWWSVDAMRITPQPWLRSMISKPVAEGGLGVDPKYWFAVGQTWNEDNPNAFAGYHNPYGMMVLFDEAAGIPSSIWDVTEGFFTEENPYRIWLAASQMRSRQGRFYEVFYDPDQRVGWDARTLSTIGMEGVDQGVLRDQIRRYGKDSDFVKVEILGLPPKTEEGQFVPTENFEQAMANDLVRDDSLPLIMGVDPAPRGRTVIRFRQGRNARDCVGSDTTIVLEGKDNEEIAQRVKELDWKYQPEAICVDFGMGTGVIDRLKRILPIPRVVHEVKFGASEGKESEWGSHGIALWAKVRDWLPGGMIAKDDGGKGTLSYQGTNRTWKFSGREEGKKVLEAKEDLKARGVASPDDMDALACTFEIENPPHRPKRSRGFPAQGPQRRNVAEGVGDDPI